MSELRECPFCGKSVHAFNYQPFHGSCVSVVCDWTKGGCGATGGFRDSEDFAIAAWNTRAPRHVSGDVERCIDDLIGDSKSCGGSLAVGHIDQAEYAEGHIRAGKAKLLSLLSAPSVPSNPIAVSDEAHGILEDLVNKAQHLEYVSTHEDGDAYDKAETELAESFERVLLLLNAARSKMTVTPEAGKRYMMHVPVSVGECGHAKEGLTCGRDNCFGLLVDIDGRIQPKCLEDAENASFTPLEES